MHHTGICHPANTYGFVLLGDTQSTSRVAQWLLQRWAGIRPKKFPQCLTLEHTKERLRDSGSMSIQLSTPTFAVQGCFTLYSLCSVRSCRVRTSPTVMSLSFRMTFTTLPPTRNGNGSVRRTMLRATVKNNSQATSQIAAQLFSRLFTPRTNVQTQVWQALLRILAGTVAFHGDVVRRLDLDKASRVARNSVERIGAATSCPGVVWSTALASSTATARAALGARGWCERLYLNDKRYAIRSRRSSSDTIRSSPVGMIEVGLG